MTDNNKIRRAFANGKAFIPFITCGDPDLETSEKIIAAIVQAGADLIELGIPFSDPTAEGPVIQEGNLRALKGGVTTDRIFEMVARVRRKYDIPMVFMTYANVIYSYGADRLEKETAPGSADVGRYGPGYADDGSSYGAKLFIERAAFLGIDGLILPDVPYEEKAEFEPLCSENGLDLISMIAPTSHARIRQIASEARGFVYCVSSLGVTGVRSEITTDIGSMVRLVREVNPDIPCAVGFGISTPQQARDMAALSDGAITGSAIVRIAAQYGKDSPEKIGAYVKSMKDALRGL